MLKYRSEIDGLRALAVLPVIFFHAGFQLFAGGYIGVDVFFVISGYLITALIISEIEEGNFSVINFYERRARRLLPALYLVMLVCIPFAWFWLTPSDLKDFGKSLVAVSLFSSNILFWLESGYFEIASEFKPLLHTWSLAIEEQYYIFFPLFIMTFWRFGKKLMLTLLVLIFFISLYLSIWSANNLPTAGFYLLPLRGWELLMGAFIALYSNNRACITPTFVNQFLSMLGLVMIICSIYFFDSSTPYPSFYALLPTIGTGLLILFALPTTYVHSFLSSKLLVAVGLISYSLYLWHQPIFSFARHRFYGEVSDLILLALCVLSIAISYLSWKYVEIPFRLKNTITRKTILSLSITGFFVFTVIGFSLGLQQINYYSPNHLKNMKFTSLNHKINIVGEVCDKENITIRAEFLYCEIGDTESDYSIVIFGDSHAEALKSKFNERLLKINIKGIWILGVTVDGKKCETTIFTTNIKNLNDKSMTYCSESYSAMIDFFNESQYLILANRWSRKYFFPGSELGTPHFENKALDCIELEDYRSFVPVDIDGFKLPSNITMRDALNKLLYISISKMRTVILYPIPEIGCDPYRYNLAYKRKTKKEFDVLSFPADEYDKRNRFIIENFDKFSKENPATFIPIRMRPIFCKHSDQEECLIIYDSIPLYYDDDHLSDYGAELVVDSILKNLEI